MGKFKGEIQVTIISYVYRTKICEEIHIGRIFSQINITLLRLCCAYQLFLDRLEELITLTSCLFVRQGTEFLTVVMIDDGVTE